MFDQFKSKALQLKEKIIKNPLHKLLSEATSDENWNAPTKTLQEIADKTKESDGLAEVMKYLTSKLRTDDLKWRRLLKTLNLVDYLLRNASQRCLEELKDEKYIIAKFQSYEKNDNGVDRGQAIKEAAKSIVDLINDTEKLEQERERASQIRRNTDVSGFGVSSKSNSKPFGGFSSKDSDKHYFKSEQQVSDTYFNFRPSENSRSSYSNGPKEPETFVTKTGTKYNVENTEAKPSPKKEEPAFKAVTPQRSEFKPLPLSQPKRQPVFDLLDSDSGVTTTPVEKKQEDSKSTWIAENFSWDTNVNKENSKILTNFVQKPQENLTDNINKLYQQYNTSQPQVQQQQQFQFPQQNFNNQYQQYQYQPQPQFQNQNFAPQISKPSVSQSTSLTPLQSLNSQNTQSKKKTLEELTDLSDLGSELKQEIKQRPQIVNREDVDNFYMMNFGPSQNQNRGFNNNGFQNNYNAGPNPTYLYR